MPQQCMAEYHSADGQDSLIFSSNTLFCLLDKEHVGNHEFYGNITTIIDCRTICSCNRCNQYN
jgi:hypothetical protein